MVLLKTGKRINKLLQLVKVPVSHDLLINVLQIKTALIFTKSHKYPTSRSTGQVGWNRFYYLIIYYFFIAIFTKTGTYSAVLQTLNRFHKRQYYEQCLQT